MTAIKFCNCKLLSLVSIDTARSVLGRKIQSTNGHRWAKKGTFISMRRKTLIFETSVWFDCDNILNSTTKTFSRRSTLDKRVRIVCVLLMHNLTLKECAHAGQCVQVRIRSRIFLPKTDLLIQAKVIFSYTKFARKQWKALVFMKMAFTPRKQAGV